MNTKLLASIAIFALLMGTISTLMQSTYAVDTKTTKKDIVKEKTIDVKIKPKITMPLNDKTKVTKSTPSNTRSTTTKVTVNVAEGSSANTKCNNNCYIPNKAKIAVGGIIMWKNLDSAAHTVTATDGAFDSGLVMVGKTFSHKFSTSGTFGYVCTVHPWMKGTVTVS